METKILSINFNNFFEGNFNNFYCRVFLIFDSYNTKLNLKFYVWYITESNTFYIMKKVYSKDIFL